MKDASEGKISLERETLAGLLERWLEHIEARGRARRRRCSERIVEWPPSSLKSSAPKRSADCEGETSMPFYDELRSRGPSPTSVRRYHAVLSRRVKPGVRWGLLGTLSSCTSNPAFLGTVSACRTDAGTDELPNGAAQTRDPGEFASCSSLLPTGCIRGELCGLQWTDVDLRDGTLAVRKSASDLPGRLVAPSSLPRGPAEGELGDPPDLAQRSHNGCDTALCVRPNPGGIGVGPATSPP